LEEINLFLGPWAGLLIEMYGIAVTLVIFWKCWVRVSAVILASCPDSGL
jgi:hypothetical protein